MLLFVLMKRTLESGVVTLLLDSNPVPVFCHMGDFGCGDGGWTPVMKIDGSKVFFLLFFLFYVLFFSCICRNNELLKHTLTSSSSSHYDLLTLLKWSLNWYYWYLYSPLISFRGNFRAPDFTWSALLQSIRDKDGLIAIMASCNTKHVGFFLWTTLHRANCCITGVWTIRNSPFCSLVL